MTKEQMEKLDNTAYFTVAEIRELIYANKISTASILSMIHANLIPTEKLMARRYLIPAYWVREKLNAGFNSPISSNEGLKIRNEKR